MNFEILTMVPPTWVPVPPNRPLLVKSKRNRDDDDEYLHTDCLSRSCCNFFLFIE
jgi:hypothetical protein